MRNNINITFNTIDENTVKLEKLYNKQLKKMQNLWGYKTREIILLNNYYCEDFEQWIFIENISEDILAHVQILTYITNGVTSGEDGLNFSDLFSVSSLETHAVMTSANTARIYARLDATALTSEQTGYESIPIFWNIKLIYKPILIKV